MDERQGQRREDFCHAKVCQLLLEEKFEFMY